MGKITLDEEKKAAFVQTIGRDKRKEITLPTWINVPLDISIFSHYLFSDVRTKQSKQMFAKKKREIIIYARRMGTF